MAVQSTCCWKRLLCPSGCSHVLHSSWVAEAAAASEQVKGLGRIRKVVMKTEISLGEGRLSQPSLFVLHYVVPWVVPIHEGTWGSLPSSQCAASSESLTRGSPACQLKQEWLTQPGMRGALLSSPCRRNPTQVHPPAPC